MKKNIFKNTLVWSLLIFGIVSFWFITYETLNTKTHYIHANYIADFDNDKKVSWFADNIFAWKIIENLWIAEVIEWGTKIPSTLFKVEVIYDIKGKTKKIITVKQEAGYDKYGNLYISEGTQYMKEWSIYLLTTKWTTFTILSHSNGSHLLISDNKKNKPEIKEILKNNKKIKDFRKAYKEEILYEWELKISSEKNAYKKLSKEDKEKFENIENGFLY